MISNRQTHGAASIVISVLMLLLDAIAAFQPISHAYYTITTTSFSTTTTTTTSLWLADPVSSSGSNIIQSGVDRVKPLSQIHRYRGVVDTGYGRGGKKLGVPTANLPASLFQDALEAVAPGVYFGWTSLEREGAENPYKAVVNVGFSPTFEGNENPEKIIEAHLILSSDLQKESMTDFYGQVIRLQLTGFLRDEQKFDSFPDLIAQINADIDDARAALDMSPYSDHQTDDFLEYKTTGKTWIGSGGGDETASWAFEDLKA